ncbi:MAG TPA: S8 family serine peptidase, partial [Pirellula sp.]|nr:S8 family serine peptidase [Pirellula sp.]
MDKDGHGTHVAGTAAAAGNNGIGVTGVSWNSKIMALKVANAGGGIPTSATIEALNYLVMMKTKYGINIVVSNNSYGGPGFSQASLNSIQRSINAGVPFVAAAGNSSQNNDILGDYPNSYNLDGIISVAATDNNDQIAGFSSFGLTTVDLAAPGVNVLSTTLGGGYGLLSGTSMASPHVAGVVALLAGAVPGASVDQLKASVLLGANPLSRLTGLNVSGARLNAAKSLFVSSAGLGVANTDVDIYQFKLGIGERAIIDIDSANSGLDSVLQIFDSHGVPQSFVNATGVTMLASDNDAAPGEQVGLDSYADFTATAPGVYYAAVSSVGNTTYDPLSSANRQAGKSTGAYRITLSARHLQDFVITAEDASQYSAGDTFTIFGVPDINAGSSGRTFEFTFGLGGQVSPGNIPIHLNANWRFPDVAQAITRAINEGLNKGPAVSNFQQLPNGQFGLASPLPAVHARALGGIGGVIDSPFRGLQGDKDILLNRLSAVDELGTNKLSALDIQQQISGPFTEVNQGLQLFTRRRDGVILFTTTTLGGIGSFLNVTSLSNLGIGHDRVSTNPISYTSLGDGTSEKFVIVSNAAWINGNNQIIVDPDEGE